jgi:hypothetical protein
VGPPNTDLWNYVYDFSDASKEGLFWRRVWSGRVNWEFILLTDGMGLRTSVVMHVVDVFSQRLSIPWMLYWVCIVIPASSSRNTPIVSRDEFLFFHADSFINGTLIMFPYTYLGLKLFFSGNRTLCF